MTRSEPQPLYPADSSPGDDARAVLDDPHTIETLVRHDEASHEELLELEADPAAARALERLRIADRWLEEGLDATNGPQSEFMIDAEELYSFGGGPGAEPLDPERRTEIEAYLAEHPEEAGWVEALGQPIPVPLEVEPLTPDESRIRSLRHFPGAETHGESAPGRRVPSWLAWAPLAAAALVLAMSLGGKQGLNALEGGLPESPIVRSTQSDSQLFPRGRVLAPVENMTTYAMHPLFEVTPVEGATRYRFELRANANGAFEQGDVVWTETTTDCSVTSPAFQPGVYSWAAWATVDGLERSLGTCTFWVVPPLDGDLMRSATGSESDSRSTREDVRRLHGAGFLTDARYRARALPPGEERARYLSGSQ